MKLEWREHTCKNGRIRLNAYGENLKEGDIYIHPGEGDSYHTVWMCTGIHRSYKSLDKAKQKAEDMADRLYALLKKN